MSSHHQQKPESLGILFWLGVYAAMLFVLGMALKGFGL